jgi:hypothetical protein
MANAVYPEFKESLLKGDVDLDTATLAAVLVDGADYTYSSAHANLSDVPSGARVALVDLTSVTVANGLIDAADAVFTAVTGDPCEILILYINTGNAATSKLVAYYDTGVTGLPVTPNGGNINITFNASGIVQL